MRLVRVWIGLVLLALGAIGILAATGVGTGGVADWWPIAVIGLGFAAMLGLVPRTNPTSPRSAKGPEPGT